MASEASAAQQKATRTAADLTTAAADKHGSATAMRYKHDGEWMELSFEEVAAAVDELARGLIDLGISGGDRVGILANTRGEWSLASFAISAAGGVVVPVYPTNSPEECEWVLGNSGSVAVVVEDESQLAKIDKVRDKLNDLRHTIGIELGVGDTTIEELRQRGSDSDGELEEELGR